MGKKTGNVSDSKRALDTERKATSELENHVAKTFNTKRISLRDKVVLGAADVEHNELYIKCHRRKEISVYKWYDHVAEETPTDKTPFVVIKSAYKPPLAVIALDDFVSMYHASDEDLVKEIKELKNLLEEFKDVETVEQRRKRISTYPYVPLSKRTNPNR